MLQGSDDKVYIRESVIQGEPLEIILYGLGVI